MFKRNGKILRWRKEGHVAEKWSDNQVEKRWRCLRLMEI
jgi:hypothetical protein